MSCKFFIYFRLILLILIIGSGIIFFLLPVSAYKTKEESNTDDNKFEYERSQHDNKITKKLH
ncbi:hypothetical protein ['Camptotheca acuminata' phytoplasma]|uniref:hypothetical protein n=1 Tax='Camptotheca acuminata' phytoplasma TaxID=3239192 RepID=UPI003519E16C